jgi:oligoendopeptidase F
MNCSLSSCLFSSLHCRRPLAFFDANVDHFPPGGQFVTAVKTLPNRTDIQSEYTWDLGSLFASDAAWEKSFKKLASMVKGYAKFKGKLGKSPKVLAACLQFDTDFSRLAESVGVYAFLRTSEDQASSASQRMKGRYTHVATQAGEMSAYIRPEILAIKPAVMKKFLKSRDLKNWTLSLDRILRYGPHTLSDKEETLLAMQGQMSEASNNVFRQLNDADLKWGAIEDENGEKIELGHSAFAKLLQSPTREVRANAFHAYYAEYEQHKNTIAAALDASNKRDAYYAKVRGFDSAIEAALFPDNVPLKVYDNLIKSIRANLPVVHRYYDLRRRKMKLDDIHHYDTYVPILSEIQKKHTWEQASRVIIDALQPLGNEYCTVLNAGLDGERWCDRYPNLGKQSGAFSSGSYDAKPYILMNYQDDVLDHVFTLAHEAGHSMHSYFSAKHQPFQYYDYTIFVAEVASTFNEQLLMHHLMQKADTKEERAFLINQLLDDIRSTVVRQTMFAEFEKITHAFVEKGEPLTVELLRTEYRKLLEAYFGPGFTIDKELELECLRIPHFYRAFYVYKYATGLSAAIALSQRVLKGGRKELDAYLGFLKGGCSKDPLDLLRGAGVDMEKPTAVNAAMKLFGELVDELDSLL